MENYLFYSTLRNRFYILYTVCKVPVLVPVPVRKKYFINKLPTVCTYLAGYPAIYDVQFPAEYPAIHIW